MTKNDVNDEYPTNTIIDKTMSAVEYQSQFIPEQSNLKPFAKKQIPKDIIAKRIQNDIRELQVTAGLTAVQRKILLAHLEIMKFNVDRNIFKRTTDTEIAKRAGVQRDAVANFKKNPTCTDSLIACTKVVIENAYPDIIAGLWKHGETSYQPLIKLLEIINQYQQRSTVENINKNLNVNLELGNSPDAIMKQVVIKFGSVGYNRERFQDEIMAVWDSLKAEGAF
jgi:hypothetical protein